MKILLDLIASRTIDEYPWLKETKSDQKSSKVDWHIWLYKDLGNVDEYGLLVEEPSNWRPAVRGGAWTETGIDTEERKQYYLHLFLNEQPDPNWESSEIKQSLSKSSIKFWP